MKFLHISDLHLGKRVHEFSMIQDQEHILEQIIQLVDAEAPDGILIAGDIYDKSVPSSEAIQLFDDFLFELSERAINVFIISGNHDSPERLSFGSRIMDKSGIHISKVYDGAIEPITLSDEYGPINIFMLPFVKPAGVRRFFPDEEIETYDDAVRVAVEQMNVNSAERNVLITHQFITGAVRSDSEEVSVGGTDNVSCSHFAGFDYVALGHIHGPQHILSQHIRYCGSPLKYSFSEAAHKKSATLVSIKQKGDLTVRCIDLIPKRAMVELRGSYMELTAKSFYDSLDTTAFVHITLTDEDDILDAIGKLRAIYPYLMKLDYDNTRTRKNNQILGPQDVNTKSPLQLFEEFYEVQNNRTMSATQKEYLTLAIDKIWEGSE